MCKYESEYTDYETKKLLLFKCKEKAVKDGFCIFHHPEYWKQNSKEVAKEFHKKVESVMKHNEKLLCIGYNLPNISLSKKEFKTPTYFSKATFNERADFHEAVFKEVYFLDAVFNEASFSLATFNGIAHFDGATFNERADFYQATFNERADFYRAVFKEATFSHAIFNEEIAHFDGATFNERADFGGAVFKEATFSHATFNGSADFCWAVFKDASFSLATFNGRADFCQAKFNENAYFRGAVFKDANFSHATFNERTEFDGATFNENAYFANLKNNKGNSQYGNSPVLFFQSVIFNNPEKAHFDDFDLSNTSFVYTDVSRIDVGERVRWEANKKLLDARRADKEKVPYKVVATVFRRLRRNLESKLRYVEAGRFFVAEMEVKRKNVGAKNRLLKWLRTNVFSTLAWYKYFSNYGEDYQRILPWIVFTLFVPAFLTTLVNTPLSCPLQFITNFQKYTQDYTFAFFQLKTNNMIELAIRILSLLFMGQLYIALKRQYERSARARLR